MYRIKIVEVESCVEGSYLIRPVVAMLPAWFRLAQCIRRYRDTKEAFPHLANALKYSMSFFVVIFSSLSFVTGSLNDHYFIDVKYTHLQSAGIVYFFSLSLQAHIWAVQIIRICICGYLHRLCRHVMRIHGILKWIGAFLNGKPMTINFYVRRRYMHQM